MTSYVLISLVLAVALFIEGERHGIPRNTMLGWAIATALLGAITLPLYLWWRMRWNRERGILPAQPTSPADSTSWKRFAVYFVLGIVVLGVAAVIAIATQL